MNYPFNIHGLKDIRLKVKHAYQRAFRGYDDTAYWSLCNYLTDISLPVLKRYRNDKGGYPLAYEIENRADWEKILDKMIRAFQLIQEDESSRDISRDEWVEVDTGLELFAKYFKRLWD